MQFLGVKSSQSLTLNYIPQVAKRVTTLTGSASQITITTTISITKLLFSTERSLSQDQEMMKIIYI